VVEEVGEGALTAGGAEVFAGFAVAGEAHIGARVSEAIEGVFPFGFEVAEGGLADGRNGCGLVRGFGWIAGIGEARGAEVAGLAGGADFAAEEGLVGSLGEGGGAGLADGFGDGWGRDVVEGVGRGCRGQGIGGRVVGGGGEMREFGFGGGNWSAVALAMSAKGG